MKVSAFASNIVFLSALGMLFMATIASADDAARLRSETGQMDTLATSQGPAKVQGSLVTQFSSFAGSDANAQNLVTGLRSGTPITLTSPPTTGNPTGTALTFDTPTRPMGHGNVFISLALAKQQLGSYGITDPTPQELQAALTGGTITTGSGATAQTITLKGVLTQRADGMGWGEIAKAQGTKLGPVVSGLKRANAQLTANAATGASATTTTNAGVHAQGSSAASLSARGNSANAPGHNNGGITTGSGVVTAAGARLGAGGGIVTGSGAGITARGGVNAQGQAKGLNKP